MGLIMSLPKDLKIHLWFRYLDNCSRVLARSAYCRPGYPKYDDDWIHLAAQHDYGYDLLMRVWGFIPTTQKVAEAAARHGQIDIVRTIGPQWHTNMIFEAARGGHQAIVKHLFPLMDRSYNAMNLILEGAVLGNHLELLRFALTFQITPDADTPLHRAIGLVAIAVRKNSIEACRIGLEYSGQQKFHFDFLVPTNVDSTDVLDLLWQRNVLIVGRFRKVYIPHPKQCTWVFEHNQMVLSIDVIWCVGKYFNLPNYADDWCKKYGPFYSSDVSEAGITKVAEQWMRRKRYIIDGCFCSLCTGEWHPDSLPKFKDEYDMVIYMTERGLNPECFWKTKK